MKSMRCGWVRTRLKLINPASVYCASLPIAALGADLQRQITLNLGLLNHTSSVMMVSKRKAESAVNTLRIRPISIGIELWSPRWRTTPSANPPYALRETTSLRRALRFPLKLDVAFLGDRGLFDRDHLALHLG